METIIFLILFPAAISLVLLSIPVKPVRRLIAVIANIALIAETIHLLYSAGGETVHYELENVWIERAMMALEAALSFYILYMGVRFRRYLVVLFTLLQLALLIHFETVAAPGIHVAHSLFVDNFSIILALIIGVIGSIICLYAIGYIEEYQFISAFFIVVPGVVHRIAGIAKIDEIHTLYDSSVPDVQTRNDSLSQHMFSLPC